MNVYISIRFVYTTWGRGWGWECGWAAGRVEEGGGREARLLWLETTCCASRWNSPDPFRIQFNTFPPLALLALPFPLPCILFWTTQVSKCSPTISISLLLTLRLTLTLTPLLLMLLLLFDFVWNINIGKASAKSKHSHRNMAWEAKGEGQLLLLAPLTTTLVRQHDAPRDPPPQNSNALQQIRLYLILIGKKTISSVNNLQ